MKLFGLPSGIALASLFWDLVFAKIVMEPLPLSVKVGLTYKVDWHSDKDYRISDFALVHWEDGGDWTSRVSVVDHWLNTSAGVDSTEWRVPAVKNNGFYMLWMNALDVDEEGNTHGSGFAATTNNFEIAGGPTLYSKEIAGVVIGTLAALILFFGLFRVGARCLRKRKSLAVNLSEAPEGGYSDSVTNAGTPDIIVTTR